jgi:hypothetical protein
VRSSFGQCSSFRGSRHGIARGGGVDQTGTDGQLTPEAILNLGLGFWASKTLLSAVELGLFTELASSGPMDLDAIIAQLGLHRRSARDFLDALVALGMLERDNQGLYANTAATAAFLDRRKPSYVGGMLEMSNARLYSFWGSLTEGLRTGEPQNEAKQGRDIFQEIYTDPVKVGLFAKAMTSLHVAAAQAVAAKFPWQDYKTFVDVGAGEGALPAAVAAAHPHLTGGGFDLPAVRPHFEAYVAHHGLADRLRFRAGDFFVDPLPAADVLVMGHVLHDFDLDRKRLLLRKAYDALPSRGSLIVYEDMIDDDRRGSVPALLMSLNMLIETRGGSNYTVADCIGWMREVGFGGARTVHLTGSESMVVAVK